MDKSDAILYFFFKLGPNQLLVGGFNPSEKY